MEKRGKFLKLSTLKKKDDGYEYKIFLKNKTKRFLLKG